LLHREQIDETLVVDLLRRTLLLESNIEALTEITIIGNPKLVIVQPKPSRQR
jgi:hypothetical protein